MPPAGLNLQFKVIRINDQADDDIGGAQPSGTVLYPLIYGRMVAKKPTQALLEQGLVTPTIFTAVVSPGNISLQYNDQFEVIFPPQSPHLGKRFVVIGIQDAGMTDVRTFKIVTLRRFEQANATLLQ